MLEVLANYACIHHRQCTLRCGLQRSTLPDLSGCASCSHELVPWLLQHKWLWRAAEGLDTDACEAAMGVMQVGELWSAAEHLSGGNCGGDGSRLGRRSAAEHALRQLVGSVRDLFSGFKRGFLMYSSEVQSARVRSSTATQLSACRLTLKLSSSACWRVMCRTLVASFD